MRRTGGFTLVELLIVLAIIGLLATIAVPGLLGARRQANEASAVASLRVIADAQHVFAETCADGVYATRLTQLAISPESGGPAFISPDLGGADTIEKSGYRIVLLRASDGTHGRQDACNGVPAAGLTTSFFATADPIVAGGTGDAHLWLGVDGVVFADASPILATEGRAAPAGGRPIDGTPVGGRTRPAEPPPVIVP